MDSDGHRVNRRRHFHLEYRMWLIIAKNIFKNQKVLYGGWMAAFILVFLQVTAGALHHFLKAKLIYRVQHALIHCLLFWCK